jgi:hypothetical protein
MEKEDYDILEKKVRSLTVENSKLKKAIRWLTIFVLLVVMILLYNLLIKA